MDPHYVILKCILLSMTISICLAGPIFRDAAQCERVMYRTGQFIRNHWEDIKARYEMFRDDPKPSKDDGKNVINYQHTNLPTDKTDDIVDKIRSNLMNAMTQRTAHSKDLLEMLTKENTKTLIKHIEDDHDGQDFLEDMDLLDRLAEYDPKLIPCLGFKKSSLKNVNFLLTNDIEFSLQ